MAAQSSSTPTEAMDVDDIDTETLQAQIDLTMSFAHQLALTWVKPSLLAAQTSNTLTDKDVEEYLRRPPRLGVGAVLPETAVSSRESMRLKSHLTGKKRAREDEDTKKQVSDNEDESRASAIQKKVKVDPFALGKKNKKGKGQPTTFLLPPAPVFAAMSTEEDPGVGMMDEDEDLHQVHEPTPTSPQTPAPESRKKKRKNRARNASGSGREVLMQEQGTTDASTIAEPIADMRPKTTTIGDPSATLGAGITSIQPPLLTAPILNLAGPPPDQEHSDGGGSPNGKSPKKKRKRRKKRMAPGTVPTETMASAS